MAHWYSHISIAVTVVISIFSEAVLGDCMQSYPDSKVNNLLNKPEYEECTVAVITEDYASFLKEQHRLLVLMRAAYVRKLAKDLEEQEQQVRLSDFDDKLEALATIKESLALLVSALASALENNGDTDEVVSERMQAHQQALHSLLQRSKESNKVLKHKITSVADDLETEESATFCKLDFYFRVNKNLNSKFAQCLTVPN